MQIATIEAQGQDNADPATEEALRYSTALHHGYRSLTARPLCTATSVDICRTIKGGRIQPVDVKVSTAPKNESGMLDIPYWVPHIVAPS